MRLGNATVSASQSAWGPLAPLGEWVSQGVAQLGNVLRPLNLPIGALLVGIGFGALLYVTAVWLDHRPATVGAKTVRMQVVEEGAPGTGSMPAGAQGPAPQATVPIVRVYTKDGMTTVRMSGAGSHPSQPLPRALGFVIRLAVAFAISSVLVLLFYRDIFAGYDHVVALTGELLYWPLAWPGVYVVNASTVVVPDYIFPMYVAGMISFFIATGLATSPPRYSTTRRLMAVAVMLAYVGAELAIDALLFTIPGTTFHSFGLLVRGLTGGVFFALLTFCAVYLPPPQEIRARFPRDRRAIATFLGLGITAVVLSAALILATVELLRLNGLILFFTLLLLLPIVSLPLFSVMGRTLYFRNLRKHPPPPVSVYHPSVSVLIPAYNEEEWILGAILSVDLAAGHYPGPVEIIVGSDGSTDRTVELARAALPRLKHTTCKVVDLPHGGKSNALNGALALARNEIVIRVDGDTYLSTTPGFSRIVGHFADPKVGGVQGAIHPRQKNGWTRKLRAIEIAWMHYMLRPAGMGTRSAEVIDGLFSAFRREDLVELGGWVPWNGEDTEIAIRMQRLGYLIRIEFGALAFEDVPDGYGALRRQRVRWARGVMIANGQHYNALTGPTPEFAGLAVLFWLLLMVRSGLRSLVFIFFALLLIILDVKALIDVAVLFGLAIAVRAVPLAYFLAKMRRWDVIPWIPFFPFANVIKQSFRFEAVGTFGPWAAQEYV